MKSSLHLPHALAWLCLWVLCPCSESSPLGYASAGVAPCRSVTQDLEGTTGYVHWTDQSETSGCPVNRTWVLTVPPAHGVFVYMQHVHLRQDTRVTLVRLVSPEDGVDKEEIETWPDIDDDSENIDDDSENIDDDSESIDNDSENIDNDSENIDNDSENVDNISAEYDYGSGEGGFDEEAIHEWRENDHDSRMMSIIGGMRLSVIAPPLVRFSFNMTFAVYNKSSLPNKLTSPHAHPLWQKDFTQLLEFNCSQTRPIPEAIACDGVPHCVDQEDEEGCDYTLQGCDKGWIPYHHNCIKLFFEEREFIPGHEFIYCGSVREAGPAILSDEKGIRLVADMLYKFGLSRVYLDLHTVKPISTMQQHLYRFIWQWGGKGGPIDYRATEDLKLESGLGKNCAELSLFPLIHFEPVICYDDGVGLFYVFLVYVCMKPNVYAAKHSVGVHLQASKMSTNNIYRVQTKRCEDGSLVQVFHQCAWKGHVLSSSWSPNNFALFHSRYGPPVHYSLVCDGVRHCEDAVDEQGCPSYESVQTPDNVFMCSNLQTFGLHLVCDGAPHCLDNSDEQSCSKCKAAYCEWRGCAPRYYIMYFDNCAVPKEIIEIVGGISHTIPSVPAVILDGFGLSWIKEKELDDTNYFQCGEGLSIPTVLLNNLELDCPQGEDENIPPENFTCPGFYRCQFTGQCLHPDLVCDSVPHCPYRDDETYCDLPRPANCTCEGYACSCRHLPSPLHGSLGFNIRSDLWFLRYLDLSSVKQPPLHELMTMNLLQWLNLSSCDLYNVTLVGMHQLKVLDLSYNSLSKLSSLVMEHIEGLTHLNVSGNPLVTRLDASFSAFITHNGLLRLEHLAMANTHLYQIQGNIFSSLPSLVSLDIRRNSLDNYNPDIFQGLRSLQVLYTDDPRLCCSYFHSSLAECHAPVDELSSCHDLLRLDVFRVFLWSFSLLTILGNCAVLVYRFVTKELKKTTSFHVLVCHLCVADLLMGVYMMIIGAADAHFRGHYVAHETQWKQSRTCHAAGFLAFVSSEVSAFMICLITLDRFFKLVFPFRPNLHLSAATFLKLGCLAWGLGVLLAAGPFMGQLEFYGESGLCLPLPITLHQYTGKTYAFVVFIILNFLLFLFIGLGQIAIYVSLRKAKAAVKTSRQEEDSAVARRLFLVVFTDFCCWFPVGMMGLLASCGLPIPGEVTVWVAVFVLPVNSALNPFLYTLNAVREKWRARKMDQKTKKILASLNEEFLKVSPDNADNIVANYMRSNRGARLENTVEIISKMNIETEAEIQNL